MKIGFLRVSRALVVFSVGALLFCAALLPTFVSSAETPPPVKLAIFDFELEDFSAGGQLIGESPADTAQLKLATSEARRLIAQSGRYTLVDVSGTDVEAVKASWLRKCNGCDAGIAFKLGADKSMIGIVTRISRMEYTVGFQIRDARDGAVIINKDRSSHGSELFLEPRSRLLDQESPDK